MDDDLEFLHRLRSLSGDAADDWDGFNPSAWRGIQTAAEEEEANDQESATWTPSDLPAPSSQDNGDWDSDDSARMILNLHKLTATERACGYKLSKAREFASDEPTFVRDPKELEKVDWPKPGLAMGDASPEGDTFVPWKLVVNYPDMFVGKVNSARAAPLFTLDALHENRVWDLYYIHHPPQLDNKVRKPIVFVPTYQFEHLLEVVNAKLETHLTVPPGKTADKFNMTFGMGNTPRPRFLGRSNDSETFELLYDAIPAPHPDDDLEKATKLAREGFQDLLEMIRATKKKVKKSDKNRGKRIQDHKAWGRSIKRVQRYLGLRARVEDAVAPSSDMTQTFDLSQPMTRAPEGLPLFIAIDIEAWEEDQGLITEVGIAILDTADIQNVAPGEGGQDWFPLIRAQHIRVKENSWAMNSRFVHGCADQFDFGMSEFIKLADIPSTIEQLLNNTTSTDPEDKTAKQRPVILVFHESSADLKFLTTIGYNILQSKNVIEVVDTREMHQYVGRSKNSASLASVLGSLHIPYTHLHNAGNDAVYTLQAMIGLAVKRRLTSLESAGKEPEGHIPFNEMREKEGWTSGGEDSDGGDAVKPVNIKAD